MLLNSVWGGPVLTGGYPHAIQQLGTMQMLLIFTAIYDFNSLRKMLFYVFTGERENPFFKLRKIACKATFRMIEGLRPR